MELTRLRLDLHLVPLTVDTGPLIATGGHLTLVRASAKAGAHIAYACLC